MFKSLGEFRLNARLRLSDMVYWFI
jgi:hypothetical protein